MPILVFLLYQRIDHDGVKCKKYISFYETIKERQNKSNQIFFIFIQSYTFTISVSSIISRIDLLNYISNPQISSTTSTPKQSPKFKFPPIYNLQQSCYISESLSCQKEMPYTYILKLSSYYLIYICLISVSVSVDRVDYFIGQMKEKVNQLALEIEKNYAIFDGKCPVKSFYNCTGIGGVRCYTDFVPEGEQECLQMEFMLSNTSVISMTKDLQFSQLSDETKHTICSTAKIQDYFQQLDQSRNSSYTWAYFGGIQGLFRSFPQYPRTPNQQNNPEFCGDFDPRLRPWYTKAITGKKNIGIILDISESQKDYLSAMKMSAQIFIETFNDGDMVCIATLGTETKFLGSESVLEFESGSESSDGEILRKEVQKIESSGYWEKEDEFIEVLEQFKKSQKKLCCSENNKSDIILVLFTSPTTNQQFDFNFSAIFEAYPTLHIQFFIINFSQAIHQDPQFTQIACKYSGAYLNINNNASKYDIIKNIQTIFSILASNSQITEASWSDIYHSKELGLMVSLSKPVYYNFTKQNLYRAYFFGVVGLDVMIEQLMMMGLTESEIKRRLRNDAQYRIGSSACLSEHYRQHKCNCTLQQTIKIAFPIISEQIFVHDPLITTLNSLCCGLQKNAFLGIIIGCSILVALIILVSIFLCCRKYLKKKKALEVDNEKQEAPDSERKLELRYTNNHSVYPDNQILFPMPPQHIFQQ